MGAGGIGSAGPTSSMPNPYQQQGTGYTGTFSGLFGNPQQRGQGFMGALQNMFSRGTAPQPIPQNGYDSLGAPVWRGPPPPAPMGQGQMNPGQLPLVNTPQAGSGMVAGLPPGFNPNAPRPPGLGLPPGFNPNYIPGSASQMPGYGRPPGYTGPLY